MASFLTVLPSCGPCQRRAVLARAHQGSEDTTNQSSRRGALLALLPLALAAPAASAAQQQAFLKSTGASGFLADEEEFLLNLRKDAESIARSELDAERKLLQQEFDKDQNGLCVSIELHPVFRKGALGRDLE